MTAKHLNLRCFCIKKVHDANEQIIGQYFASLQGGNLSEADYAHILANKFNLIKDSDTFERTGYKFILTGDIEVKCEVRKKYVAIHSDSVNRLFMIPFAGLEALKEFVCENYGGVSIADSAVTV